MANPIYAQLCQNVISTANFLETNQSEIEEAAELQQTIFQQLYDEALEAREDEARVKMIAGLVTVVVGGICIVATAGAATPAVIGVAGTIVGTSCAVYGASEMGEGAGLFYLAEQGDIYTQPFNPIRDTVFCGNQGLYDGWGQANLFVAGVLISGSSTVNALGATTINREVAVEVTKEVTKDMVLGGLSDHVVSSGVDFAQKKFGFNNTTALLFEIGAGLATDKVINGPISKTIEVESGKLKGVDIDQRVPEILGGESGSKSGLGPDELYIDDWTGYPDAPKPAGPFRILEGAEYEEARKLANKTNAKIHRDRPDLKGAQIHEMHPVKLGGSPTDIDNKIALPPKEHAKYTAFWNKVLREQQKGQ